MDIALNSSIYVSSPEFAGWLYKKGFRWRKLWRKRWVALHGAEIVYMEKEPTLENSSMLKFTKAKIISSTVIINTVDIDGDVNGFSIHFNDGIQPVWHLRAESPREKKSWLMRLSHAQAIVQWLGDFEKVRILGVGGTGIVYELLHKSSNQRFAMKEMEIKNKVQMQMAISEAEMLKDIVENVHHPNILQIERVFQVGSKFYLVFPLCTGGELYEYIIKRGSFTEYDAASMIREIVSGLHALHEHDILHLDIKPENILFESTDDKAKLKIIDFGLSKVFSSTDHESESDPTKKFSMEKMMESFTIFMETGQLYKQRLRGTMGYMSPEYILTGFVSKASDVYAVGVILYIFLCGKPPFSSNSMRDMLEQATKGSWVLKGPEWDSVSIEAKDLVREMLSSNPLERITTQDILQHPWLERTSDVDESGQVDNALRSDVITADHNKINQKSKNRSEINLDGALRQLSGYVKQRRSEKLASTLTRLVSSLFQPGEGDCNKSSTLADHFLLTINDTSTIYPQSTTEVTLDIDMLKTSISSDKKSSSSILVLNSQFREALAGALFSLDEIEDGRLTIRQFSAIIMQFIGYSEQSVSLTTVILGKLVDRDGDGFITADDVFTFQAMVLQKSEVILKQIIFRVYTEALWYPGKQVNLLNAKQQITSPRRSSVSDATTAGTSTRLSSGTPINIWDNIEQVHFVDPPKHITAKHVASVFEKLGYDPNHGSQAFVILCEALQKAKVRNENNDGQVNLFIDKRTDLIQLVDKMKSDAITSSPPSSKDSSLNNNSRKAHISNLKMDVSDFIKSVEIDDILVQALTRRARYKMMGILKKAEEVFYTQQTPLSLSISPEQQITNHSTAVSIRSITAIASDILANEFKIAFQH